MSPRRAQLRFLSLMGGLWLALLVLSLRFERPEFRPWEVLADSQTRMFAPRRTLQMRELGDLAAWSWVRELQSWRATRFTTDRWGFRNPDGLEAPRIVVLGDSYVGGSGLTDDATLTARMSRLLGEPVYGMAISSTRVVRLFLRDPRFAAHPPEVVVYAPNQRMLVPLSVDEREGLSWISELAAKLRSADERAEIASELTRRARYAYNGLSYQMFGRDELHQLPDGTRALMLPLREQGLASSFEQRRTSEAFTSLLALAHAVEARGSRFVFAPLPDPGNVYPELYSDAERAQLVQPSVIDVLVARGRAAGVNVVDFPGVFRANKWPYLYRTDDTHWNEQGVELSAQVLSAVVRALRTPNGGRP